MQIDINCDMGEGFGRYSVGNDAGVMPYITSANIACGLHAGDPQVMRETLRLAKQHGVAAGAHPGWPDLQGFGRRDMGFSADEAEAIIAYQIGALAGIAACEGSGLRHVKPHGALYNQAVRDGMLASAIARAIHNFDRHLILVGLAGSTMIDVAQKAGLTVANEGFADRRYNKDGTLVSRREPHAVIQSPIQVAAQAVALAREGVNIGGKRVPVQTLCLHGDHPNAVENAMQTRQALEQDGFEVRGLAS